jgi:hypothetical protein
MAQKPYTKEELQNILRLIKTVNRIRRELIEEGIPVEKYERVFIHGEDPLVVFGGDQSPDKAQ